MRTLNDYFIDGGIRSGIHNTATCPTVTCPEAGLLVGLAVNISAAATTATNTFVVWKNSVNTGERFTLVGAHAVDTGSVALPSGPVNVVVGDRLQLISGGETGNAPTAHLNWIIRR